jgi:hypothetical protein
MVATWQCCQRVFTVGLRWGWFGGRPRKAPHPSPLPEGEGTDRVVLSRYIDLNVLSRTQVLKTLKIGSLLSPGRSRTDRVVLSRYIDLKILSRTQALKTLKIGSLPSVTPGRRRTDGIVLSRYIDLKILSRTQALKTTRIDSLPPLPPGGEGWGEGDRFH